jgi:hypothetical protein
MAGALATSFGGKRGRSKEAAFSDFFRAKVKTLLLRTRNVVQTLPPEIGGASVALLADLAPFADAVSVEDVLHKLGGENALVARIFVSVTNESERRQLELYASRHQGQKQQELIMKELQSLVEHVQWLAQQLPSKDPLVAQVLAMAGVEEEDEAGTGESLTEEQKKKKKKQKAEAKESAKCGKTSNNGGREEASQAKG